MQRRRIGLVLSVLMCAIGHFVITQQSEAQLRVVTYNAATDTNPNGDVARAGMATVLQAIGIEAKNGVQRPLDILSLQEVTTSLQGATSIVSILNSIYGAGTYARSTIVGGSVDGTTEAVIYNTHTVQLVAQASIGTASQNGAARTPLRFEFRPVGYDSSADFFLYSDHYKSGADSADRRTVEAQMVRADAATLPAGSKIIYSGDFNVQNSSEGMYQTLTAAGAGQAIDPLATPGNWHANSSFAALHSQATQITGVNNLTGGGMDDRFDFQMVTASVLSGQGFSYIGPNVPNLAVAPSQNSYHVFGNNGTTYNNNINAPGNTALPVSEYNPAAGQPSRTAVLNALATASDHLPVVADYQLPASMSVTLGAVPSRVIVGATAHVNLDVSNNAPVGVTMGADELNYQVSATGDAQGSATATALALQGPNAHVLTLATNAPGDHGGVVSVVSSSQSVAHGLFSQTLNYTVLDHAAAEFVGATATHTLDIDLGTLPLGGGPGEGGFQIANLAGLNRAGLDFLGFEKIGDAGGRFSQNWSLFQNLDAGSASSLLQVFMLTDQVGSFAASYLLQLGDEQDLPGAVGGQYLLLNVHGTVAVPEPATLALAAWGPGLLAWSICRGRGKYRNQRRAR